MEEATIDIKGNQNSTATVLQFLFNGNYLTAIATMKGSIESQVGGGGHEPDASVDMQYIGTAGMETPGTIEPSSMNR